MKTVHSLETTSIHKNIPISKEITTTKAIKPNGTITIHTAKAVNIRTVRFAKHPTGHSILPTTNDSAAYASGLSGVNDSTTSHHNITRLDHRTRPIPEYKDKSLKQRINKLWSLLLCLLAPSVWQINAIPNTSSMHAHAPWKKTGSQWCDCAV